MPDTTDTTDRSTMDAPALPVTPATPATADGMTAAEAAQALGVSERTVRRWVSAGELAGSRVRGPHGPELRIDRGAVAAYRLLQPPAAEMPDTPAKGDSAVPVTPDREPDTPAVPDMAATVARLESRLDGAQLAAKLHAQRAAEARQQAREERARGDRDREVLETELQFLRAQLVQAREAERELRLLMAQTTQALQAMTERAALPPARPRRWWWPW